MVDPLIFLIVHRMNHRTSLAEQPTLLLIFHLSRDVACSVTRGLGPWIPQIVPDVLIFVKTPSMDLIITAGSSAADETHPILTRAPMVTLRVGPKKLEGGDATRQPSTLEPKRRSRTDRICFGRRPSTSSPATPGRATRPRSPNCHRTSTCRRGALDVLPTRNLYPTPGCSRAA